MSWIPYRCLRSVFGINFSSLIKSAAIISEKCKPTLIHLGLKTWPLHYIFFEKPIKIVILDVRSPKHCNNVFRNTFYGFIIFKQALTDKKKGKSHLKKTGIENFEEITCDDSSNSSVNRGNEVHTRRRSALLSFPLLFSNLRLSTVFKFSNGLLGGCSSKVIGAYWYLFSVELEMDCWQGACASHASCNSETLYCSEYFGNEAVTKDYWFLDMVCPADSEVRSSFDYGVFTDAHNSGILESTSLLQKLLYCSWWALQNSSALCQNLKTSTRTWEICFTLCIFIGGLVLILFVFGILQAKTLSSTVREEEMRMKMQDLDQWMDSYNVPPTLKKRVIRHELYKWSKTKGLDVENLLHSFPKALRSDIKRHLSRNLLSKVPMFEKMDEQLLDAMCRCLQPVFYPEESYIVREGDPVDEMLFIMQGKLLIKTTSGERTGFLNSECLKAGDCYGEELLMWALDPNSASNLPISTKSVQTLTDVEGFVLMADDLKSVVSQFCRLHSKRIQHIYRFYSQQWRIWAARFIQGAWRRYTKKKLEVLDMLKDPVLYPSRFVATRRAQLMERVPPILLWKPAEPEFAF